MGKSFTLQSFKDEVDKKYGPMVLSGFPGEGGDIRLLPMLRHSAGRRDEISAVMERHQREGRARDAAEKASEGSGEAVGSKVDLNRSIDQIKELLVLVLEHKDDMARIVEGVGDDGQALMELWTQYQEGTQPGEASDSAS